MAVMESLERPIPGVSMTWRQLGGIAGILRVVLFIVGILTQGDTPTLKDSAAETSAWFQANADAYLFSDMLISIAFTLFLIPFFVTFYSFLAQAEGSPAVWATMALVGAILFMVIGGMASLAYGALAVAPEISDPNIVRFVQAANFYGFSGPGLGLTPFFLGSGLVIIKRQVGFGWSGWLALLLAVVGLLSLGAAQAGPETIFDFFGLITIAGFGLFIIIQGIAMLRSESSR